MAKKKKNKSSIWNFLADCIVLGIDIKTSVDKNIKEFKKGL